MSIRRSIAVLAVYVLVASTLAAGQQTQPTSRPQPTYESQLLSVWKGLHDKILVMAKDWPEDKYGWKPHPDSRSMVEEFRHVTIGLEMTSAQLAGKPFDYMARVKADEAKPNTRASVVSEMEAAIATSYALVAKSPSPTLIGWVDHQAEHYGKLVSNYRMNGIVPPISRRGN
jgi:hypothetical protein